MEFLRRHHRGLLSIGALLLLYAAGYVGVRASGLIVRHEFGWRLSRAGVPAVFGRSSRLLPRYHDQRASHPNQNLAGRVAVQAYLPLCWIEEQARDREVAADCCD